MKKIVMKSTGVYLNTLAYVSPKLLKKRGYELFCNPLAKKIKPHQLEFLQTSEMFSFIFEEKRMQGYRWGDGSKKIVLIHGWASNAFRWKKIIEKLVKDDFTVYAFDAPGHGLSEGKLLNLLIYKNCLNVFLQHVGKVDYAIAHSVGGFVLQYMLFDDKVVGLRKVVVMGAPGEANDFFDFYEQILSLKGKTTKLIIEEFENRLGYHPSYFSAKKFAKEIDIPVLLIHDKYDSDTNPNYTEELSRIIKNSKLIITEGLGHNLKSNELDCQIVDFINE